MSNIQGTGGIVNVGFTCYANAVIQAFRHYSELEKLFKEDKYTTILKSDHKYTELTKQFANMIQTLSTIHTGSSVRPMGFWSAFQNASQDTCFTHLNMRQPHDSHEFLMFLLDGLHESLSSKVSMSITKCDLKTERQKLHQKSLEAWKSNFEKQFSPFVDMFFGLFHIQLICNDCKNVSHRFETFNTLKGILPEGMVKPTLIQCLKGDLNEETIEGYECDHCKPKRTSAIKKTYIWKLPPNLIVVLKRFKYDGSKINTPIEVVSSNINLSDLYSPLSPNKKKSTYTTQSIVDHHGSAFGGHYTAQGLHNSEHKWFLYDDQSVHPVDNPVYGESTYILFLKQV